MIPNYRIGLQLIYTLLITLTFSVISVTAVKKTSPNICKLDVYLVDKWGDSWNGAKLSVSPDSDATEGIILKSSLFSPKTNAGGTHAKVALLPSTPYTFSITTKGSSVPKEYWEILWSFSTEGQTYIGDYSTTISVFCLWQSPTDYVVQVKSSSGLVTPTCETCTHPKPPPKSAVISTSSSDQATSSSDVQSSTSDVQSSTSDEQSSTSDVQSSTSDGQSSTSDVISATDTASTVTDNSTDGSTNETSSTSSDTTSSTAGDKTSSSEASSSADAASSDAASSEAASSDSASSNAASSDAASSEAASADAVSSEAASSDSASSNAASSDSASSEAASSDSASSEAASSDSASSDAASADTASVPSSRGGVEDDDYSFGRRRHRKRELDGTTPLLVPLKPKPVPAPLSPPSPYPLLLINIDGNGWFDGSGHSMYYSISDTDRTTLIALGSMCGKISEELCEEKLRDGDYVLRVGGNDISSSSSSTWTFCGVTGGAQQELEFTVKSGVCTPGIMDKYTDYSEAPQSVTDEEEDEIGSLSEDMEDVELADQDTSSFQQVDSMTTASSSTYPLLMMVISVSAGLAVLLGMAVFGVIRAVSSKQKYNNIAMADPTTTRTNTTIAVTSTGSSSSSGNNEIGTSGGGGGGTRKPIILSVQPSDIESVMEAEVSSSRHPLL